MTYIIAWLIFVPCSEVPRSPVRPLKVFTARAGSLAPDPDWVAVSKQVEQEIVFLFGMD